MEWLSAVRGTIEFIEEHLGEELDIELLSERVNISAGLFNRGFQVMTGYSVSDYIRSRRLYMAAVELKNTDRQIIDIALDYGYETHESFTKAFVRFHGITPLKARQGGDIRTFLPVNLIVRITGGNRMDYRIRNLKGFQVIGFYREFDSESSYAEIPAFWDEMTEKYSDILYKGKSPENETEKAIADYQIGEYGICIDECENGSISRFTYMIAGRYTGGSIPDGMKLYEFPAGEWAIFDCIGPLPDTLQSLNTRIFREWLPGNNEYELCGTSNVEWYDPMNGTSDEKDFHTAIWIPVKKK